MEAFLFLLAPTAFVVFGVPALLDPIAQRLSRGGRVALCYFAGVFLLTIEALSFSLIGIPWGTISLSTPLLALSAIAWWRWRKSSSTQSREHERAGMPVIAIASIAITVAVAHLALMLASSRANSPDLVFFWGVKAVRFVEARSIDAEFLRAPFSVHTHVNYPPLVPITTAWSVLVSGKMVWRLAPLLSWIWFCFLIPILFDLLRLRLGRSAALLSTAFWSLALALAFAASYSGGNAEVQLVSYITLAAVLVLSVESTELRPFGLLPVLCLSAALLTKREAFVAGLLLLAGVYIQALLVRRELEIRSALVAVLLWLTPYGLWVIYSWLNGIPLSDPIREKAFELAPAQTGLILREMIRHLSAGAYGLSWILPLALLIWRWRRWKESLPVVLPAAGLILFSFFYYLHVVSNVAMIISWTLPRLSLPALSLVILAASMVSFAPSVTGRNAT